MIESTASVVVEQEPVDRLRPDLGNLKHISQDELEALTRSIREWGLVDPTIEHLRKPRPSDGAIA